MAPPSKGANPAPGHTVDMNRIATRLDLFARKIALPSLGVASSSTTASTSTSDARTSTTSSGGFSSLTPTSTSTTTTTTKTRTPYTTPAPGSESATQAAERAAQQSSLTHDRNQDPNAGLGIGGPPDSSSTANDRPSSQLRARLLGKRRPETDDSKFRRKRRDRDATSDEDDEPGRGALGRSKKRARREVAVVDGVFTAPEGTDREASTVPAVSERGSDTTAAELDAKPLPLDDTLEHDSTTAVTSTMNTSNSVANLSKKKKKRKKKAGNAGTE
ncbi:hypothetical protein F5Y15DRAFT_319201 [Xylariaceae sp. FL0016]|nr:hypothetical protein F5Y15DRAFT_319201 [Xylariaceae sp. FL0016]